MSFREGWSNGGVWGVNTIDESWGESLYNSDKQIQYNNLLSWSLANMPQMAQYLSPQKTQTFFRNNNGFVEGNNAANI